MHDSQIGRADSTSPSGTATRRSGNVHATSYIGSSRALATATTRRNVQRRSDVPAVGVTRAGGFAIGRGVIAMAATLTANAVVRQGNQQYQGRATVGTIDCVSSSSSSGRSFGLADVGLYAAAVAGMAAALTVIFLCMRAVMNVGGFCAEGGPYVIRQHCPEGVPLLMIGAMFGLFLFGGLIAWKGSILGGPYAALVLLAWPALFLSLGWNFLEYAIRPPEPEQGIVWGWLIPGIVFVIMGGGPLLALWPSRPPPALTAARARLLNTVVAHAERQGWSAAAPSPGPAASRPSSGLPELPELPESSEPDLVSKLERLAALHRAGSLTYDEFQSAKRALIDAAGGG